MTTGFITFLIEIIKNWYTQIIAVLVGMFIIWILGFFPSRLQYHKRLNFALKISKAVSKIEISIETKELNKIDKLHKILKNFIKNDEIEDVKLNKELSFNSNKTGCSYKISSELDEGIDKKHILITSFNSFNIGFFGRLSGLKSTINEIQTIIETLSNIQKSTEKVTVHITITPRRRKENEKIEFKCDENNFSTTYNLKSIKIVNKGMSSIEENINKVFYNWMVSLL